MEPILEPVLESDIDYICNEIFKKYENNKVLLPYIKTVTSKVRNFLKKKPKSENFKRDKFIEYIFNHIESRKVKANTHVGVLAAQSIGEPVTQSALSYFHKLTGDEDAMNSLKELYNITHNKIELSVVEFHLKSKDYDSKLKRRILNSMNYVTLRDVVLDVAYDGFILRLYLCPHTIFKVRVHPFIIFKYLKEYLEDTNDVLKTWDFSINLEKLYFEFTQPASKILDWLDDHNVEYIVDSDVICVFKSNLDSFNETETEEINKNNEYNENVIINNNQDTNNIINNNQDTNNIINNNQDTNNIINNNQDTNINSNGESADKDIYNKDIDNANNVNKINNRNLLIEFFNKSKLHYEEYEKYYMVDSHYINLSAHDFNKFLNNVVITGTKGIGKVIPKLLEGEFIIEVTGTNLDSLFDNEYIDKERSHYTVYGNSKIVEFSIRKENILELLKKVINSESSTFNNQHIELLTNFMCRNGETVIPISRFGMTSDDYSFISQLSFEDPYNIIQDVLYGIEDKITSVSAKLITGIYENTRN